MRRLIDALGVTSKVCLRTGLGGTLVAATGLAMFAQAPSSTPVESSSPVASAPTGADIVSPQNSLVSAGAFSIQTVGGEINDEQLKQLLVGKVLYLRAGYLENNLEFDEHGRLTGHSPTGSFTLSQVQINKVKLSKRKLELQGDRYGLHFLGAAPFEDPTKATDRVKITPEKKTVRISFDREQVEKPKKEKRRRKHHVDQADDGDSDAKSSGFAAGPQRAANLDPSSDNKTTDPTHASQLLLTALDSVFSTGIDERMIAAMPPFWRLYYRAAGEKTDYKPTEQGIFNQSTVDQKAKLVSSLDPPSNEFAQTNGVAGMALYHAVVGRDGKVEQVVAARPIGFGLDENAEQTIRKASFQPAMKDGKPVPVSLDIVVSFRIYSKLTSQAATDEAQEPKDKPVLPGLYTVQASEHGQAIAQQSQPAAQDQSTLQPQPTESTKTPH